MVPYITVWSGEETLTSRVVEVPGVGIGYADETSADRDRRGVLWDRRSFRPGVGRPLFGQVHPMRQRRAMHRLLCSVCGGPADVNEAGALWLLPDYREDWSGWPERMAVDEPPVCVPCVEVAVRLCPALRGRAVGIRARRFLIAGVRGGLYACRTASVISAGLEPRFKEDATVTFDDPAIRYVLATHQLRELRGTSLVEVDELVGVRSCRS